MALRGLAAKGLAKVAASGAGRARRGNLAGLAFSLSTRTMTRPSRRPSTSTVATSRSLPPKTSMAWREADISGSSSPFFQVSTVPPVRQKGRVSSMSTRITATPRVVTTSKDSREDERRAKSSARPVCTSTSERSSSCTKCLRKPVFLAYGVPPESDSAWGIRSSGGCRGNLRLCRCPAGFRYHGRGRVRPSGNRGSGATARRRSR